MPNRLVIPYQLLAVLAYGKHDWIEREGRICVVGVRPVCIQLRVRPVQVQEALLKLQEEGILTSYTWNSTYFTVKLRPPESMTYE